MSKDRLLAVLVAADFFLAMALIAIEGWFHDTLPRPIREYMVSTLGVPGSMADLFTLGLWSGMVALSFLSWIALLCHWPVGRPFYVVSWVMMIFVLASNGPSILTPIGAAVSTLETLVAGMIIGLVYFSDLARSFEPRAALARGPIGVGGIPANF